MRLRLSKGFYHDFSISTNVYVYEICNTKDIEISKSFISDQKLDSEGIKERERKREVRKMGLDATRLFVT